MKASPVHGLGHNKAKTAQHLDAGRDAVQRRSAVGIVPLACRQHRRHHNRPGMHRPALEGVVEILAMRRRAIGERSAGRTQSARVADRGAWAIIVAGGERRLDVALVASGDDETDDVNGEIDAFLTHSGRHIERHDTIGQLLGDGDLRKRGHLRCCAGGRRRQSPEGG